MNKEEKLTFISNVSRERKLYFSAWFEKLRAKISCAERYYIYKYLFFLRKEEYWSLSNSFLKKLFVYYYLRKKCRLGVRINMQIPRFNVGFGVNIQHANVIINAKVGTNCFFHGCNCLGNNHGKIKDGKNIPCVGNYVVFGYGSNVIGPVRIADNIIIGANSLVTNDLLESDCVYFGVPAKKKRHK